MPSADVAMLELHDHVIWFGSGTADLYALASAAIAAGARRREKLLFVAEHPQPGWLRDIDELDRLLERGQLELLDTAAVYGSSGAFSDTRQLATFEGALADALRDGYTGIRVIADNTPFARGDDDSFLRWLRWEQLTDRFQSQASVTGICYFDRRALSEGRQADLAALHPVRSASAVEPSFSFFVDGEQISVTGTLDTFSADQFRRILDTAPGGAPLVLDLTQAEFVDHRALLALGQAASSQRPLRVRTRAIVRELAQLLKLPTRHLRFEA